MGDDKEKVKMGKSLVRTAFEAVTRWWEVHFLVESNGRQTDNTQRKEGV